MAQSQAQYTPAQILDLGRRAEADGRQDYALQLFRHLAEHYPGTPEAATATEAMSRHQRGHQDAIDRARDAFQHPSNGTARGPAAGQPSLRGAQSSQSAPGQAAKRDAAARQQNQLQLEPVTASDTSERSTAAPTPRRYLIGRILAVITIAVGAIAMASGSGLIAAVFIAPKFVDQATIGAGAWLTILVSTAMIGFGAALTLAGLAARAVFDSARTLQRLVAAEHARSNARRSS